MLRRALLFAIGLVLLDRAVGAASTPCSAPPAPARVPAGSRRPRPRRRPAPRLRQLPRPQHFDPARIDAAYGLPGYDAGANGQGLPYARAVQSLVLARRAPDAPPQCQLLHLDVVDLVDPKLERVAVLLPYTPHAPVVSALVRRADPWARVKALSSMWRYNGVALSVFWNLGRHPPPGDTGFTPNDHRRQGMADDRETSGDLTAPPDAPDPEAVALLRDFVADARAHHVDVAWVTSPMDRGAPLDADPLRRWARDTYVALAAELGVPYLSLDESAVPAFQRADLFVDSAHLGSQGAALLSDLTAKRLRGCGALR
ncbi:MAG: SGNH/GDSL hydrolase family protein [Myxococcota bacterium]